MNRGKKFLGFVLVQLIVVGAFAAAFASLKQDDERRLRETVTGVPQYEPVTIERMEPIVVEPLYDRPDIFSDEDLAAVLRQVQPRFPAHRLRPNHVEHALRTWHADATFGDPKVMSGAAMRDFLLDYGKFMESWKHEDEFVPLLESRDTGVYVNWGDDPGASVHHDHTLACITEARVPLSQAVRSPGRPKATLRDVVEQALYDFQLDERETEWSAMAFGFWLPPTKSWTNGAGRILNFDLIAKRQLRGHKRFGVCGGTHRVYSLMALWRIDKEMHDILSDDVADEVAAHLKYIGRSLSHTQFPDGHIPYNWPDEAEAISNPDEYPAYRDVISTGHHLEWLAIAPEEFHPEDPEVIPKAAKWIIENTTSKTREQILQNYTFYSHVGNALALWRKTRPADFWHKWEKDHPFVPYEEEGDEEGSTSGPDQSGDDDQKAGKKSADKKPVPPIKL